jgi:DHA2 family multidrug resistance protein-like MFS transporter
MLIASRALQGVGSAAVMAVGPAIYRQIYPHHQLGRALGLSAVIVATSSAAGPTIGGTILAIAAWPWIFAINVPLGIFAVLFSRRALPREPGSGGRLDPASAVLSALALGSLIFALDGFARRTSLTSITMEAAVGVLCAIFFIRRSLALPRPLIAIAYVSLPFFFQSALGRTPFESGLLLTSWPLAVACIAPIAGRLSDRYPAGILSTIGLSIFSLGLGLYAAMPAHPSAVAIIVHGAICGIGFGFFQSPNNRSLIGSAPRAKSGSASGVLATVRLTGQTIGAAIVGIVFGTLGAHAAHGSTLELTVRTATPIGLWIACGSAATGAILSGLRLGARQVAAPQG